MRYPAAFVAALLAAAGLQAQQGSHDLYRIDLVVTGQGYALDEPKLVGDVYVFHGWPDGALVRVRKSNVKKITKWTKNPSQLIVYRIDVLPSGHLLSRDEPTPKGNMYVFRTSHDGTVMSVRKADVSKISRLTKAEAFWEKQATLGEVSIGTLAMQGGSSQAGPSNLNAVGRPGGAPANSAPQGNWIYQGVPGVTDAYAPANATVSTPGDVPQMPAATAGSSAPQ